MALKKIKIESFKDIACSQAVPNGSIEAYINPNEYTRSVTVKYSQSQTINDPQPTLIFSGIEDESLSLGKIIVDGTGVVNGATLTTDVDTYIQNFQNVVSQYIGDTHSTPFLKVTWGKLSFVCVCKSFSVRYTLFAPDGTALRAEITLGLTSTMNYSTKVKAAGTNSPDLTHMRTVKAGDTLPLLCYQVYGDSSYYLDVARKNNLNNINDIKPGTSIYFYPLKK